MKDKLTKREKAFLEAYLEGKTLDECAKIYGSQGKDKANLACIGYQTYKRLQISFGELCDLSGLTDSFIQRKFTEGAGAEKVVVATWQGKITDEKYYPDPPTQAKYIELLGKAKGLFIDKQEVTGRDGGDIILQIAPSGSKKRKGIEI